MNARRPPVLTPHGQRVLTIIVAVATALVTLLCLHACDEQFFGRPPDAYPTL